MTASSRHTWHSQPTAGVLHSRLMFPSWGASVAAHLVLMFIFATSLKSCGETGFAPESSGEFRDVGIFVKQPADSAEPSEQAADAPNSDTSQPASQLPAADSLPTMLQQPELADVPPVETALPSVSAPVIGLGTGSPRSAASADVGNLLLPGRTTRTRPAGGLQRGDVEFFHIRDNATRVVYVLDCSGSMINYGAIRVAKAELKASLQNLDQTQQFQIVFYNQKSIVMRLPGDQQPQLYWSREPYLTQARQYIDSIRADLGTDHMPALKSALRLDPDVLFFLTDADEPQLTAADLNEIERINRGKTRIHCVEFGRGAQLNVDNFLKRLARQNGGTHRYRDVTRFEER